MTQLKKKEYDSKKFGKTIKSILGKSNPNQIKKLKYLLQTGEFRDYLEKEVEQETIVELLNLVTSFF